MSTAVDEIVDVSSRLLGNLVTNAPPKHREVEAQRARERTARRYAGAP